MRVPDVVLVVLAVLAAGVTAAGVARSDDWTDERTYRFEETRVALPALGPTTAGSAPARFEWAVPGNATGAALAVTVSFTGQAVQGGSATVRIRGVGPDGVALPHLTAIMPVAQAATSGEVTLSYNATWQTLPSSLRDTQEPGGVAWARPLLVEVVVERPSDMPVATYAFTASASGDVLAYRAH